MRGHPRPPPPLEGLSDCCNGGERGARTEPCYPLPQHQREGQREYPCPTPPACGCAGREAGERMPVPSVPCHAPGFLLGMQCPCPSPPPTPSSSSCLGIGDRGPQSYALGLEIPVFTHDPLSPSPCALGMDKDRSFPILIYPQSNYILGTGNILQRRGWKWRWEQASLLSLPPPQ